VVGDRARNSSVKPHWGAFLYAMTREVKPAVCIELGSCFGVSGLYIQAGLREAGGGQLVTFEGCRAMAEIACENYRSLGMEAFTSVVGDFDRQLAPAVEKLPAVDLAFVDGNHTFEPTVRYDALIRSRSHAGGVIVHDDIRWSMDMEKAWRTVRNQPGARFSFDAFRFGMIELGSPEQVPVQLSAWFGLSHLR
jgi:predicted O-methyltransferase YrrM